MDYLNEHLWAGSLGRALVTLAFVCAALAVYGGVRGTNAAKAAGGHPTPGNWAKLTGWSFAVSAVSIAGVIALLLTMMTNQWYEYAYVQQHVNDELPFRYVFTAFWEGQEGSFLLWLLWHGVLGLVVWGTNKRWRLPVIAVVGAVQVVLLSMLLGVYLPFGEELRIGSSPFLLLRETMRAPIFEQADYVSLIEGTGLNPLLQNYWMIIHPPTLFLGFASTVIPFAFAIAGLWQREHRDWLNPALKWGLFSAGILGIGILMGGAWAYEALNFGGYWAWDPVENTSLVPWLLLVAGLHTTLIARATGYSIRSSYVFYALTFVAVLYSSLLTRSGLLGETSVHAFTEMGLEAQLVFLVGSFGLLSLVMIGSRWRGIPTKVKEEAIDSREFWMFLGSLVLLFSAGMITVSSSLPVINKVGDALGFDFGHLTINEPVAHYNKYQLWVGVFMALFTGTAQYLRWRGLRQNARRRQLLRMGAAAAISVGLGIWTANQLYVQGPHFTALAAAAYFALFASLDYVLSSKVALWQRLGSTASHVGFATLLIGVLFSGLNQEHISKNTFAMDGLLDEERIGKNVLVTKGLPMVINGYEVTYLSDTLVGNRRDYRIQYRTLDVQTGDLGEAFVLEPYALYTNDFSKIASMNPDTKHYWDHDVFTHITALPPGHQSQEEARTYEDSLDFERVDLALGDSAQLEQHQVRLLGIVENPTHPEYEPEPGDVALGAEVELRRLNFDTVQTATAMVVLRENLVYSYPAQVNAFSVRVQLPEEALSETLTAEEELDYRVVELAPGEQARLDGVELTFARFEPQASHPAYKAEPGDVAVAGELALRSHDGTAGAVRPLFFIRGNTPYQVKDVDPDLGIHAQLISIDPATGRGRFAVARADRRAVASVPIEIAENASRTDWVLLEATVFPGINLFWAGSVTMLLGLLISMGFRIREKRIAKRTPVQQPPAPASAPHPSREPELVG